MNGLKLLLVNLGRKFKCIQHIKKVKHNDSKILSVAQTNID